MLLVHGVDLVEVERIAMILREHGEQFIERCFTPAEREYAEGAQIRRAERFAARFAAKEAVMKALGTGWRDGVTWRDIEVIRASSGRPELNLTGKSADLAARLGVRQWQVSLSHTDSVAMASVIGWGSDSH